MSLPPEKGQTKPGSPVLHVHGPLHEHEEVFLVGNKEALLRLRDALNMALETGNPTKVTAFVADGEGFNCFVVPVDLPEIKDWAKHELPYTDPDSCFHRPDEIKPHMMLHSGFSSDTAGSVRDLKEEPKVMSCQADPTGHLFSATRILRGTIPRSVIPSRQK